MGAAATPAQRPRVLHVAQVVAGGIASYLEEIADDQSERFGRSNVAFVVPSDTRRFARLDPEQLIFFRSASRRPLAVLDFARRARAAIADFKPDIVHLHSSFAGAIVRCMLGRGAQRPRVIYCPHGWAFGMDVAPAAKRSYAFVERWLARATDLILVNSRSEYDLGARYGIPAGKMRIVANGIGWAARPQRAARSGPLRLAFIGRHDRQKGLDILLDAIRRIPLKHIQFDVVGDRILAPRVGGSSPVNDNVTFHGWLSRSEIGALLEQVDAVIMPSRWEAFGLVAIEAMRAGVPVIASNRGALPEVVQHSSTGLVFNLDDDDALGALLSGLTPSQLDGLGAAGRERWEAHYVSDRMNGLISDAYMYVLHQPERRQDAAAAAAQFGLLTSRSLR